MTPEVEKLIRDTVPIALGVLLRRGERFADAEDAVQDAAILAADAW
jgi:predicted RNA polymerase sigma factor